MADFTINGVAYQSKLMEGDVWPLVMKRLLPVLTSVVGVSDELQALFPAAAAEATEEQAEPAEDEFEGIETPHARAARIAMPVAQRLARMSDADVKFILDACMDVTTRRLDIGVGWVPVRQRGVIQNSADGKFIARLGIAWHVIGENAADMFSRLGLDMNAFKAILPPGFNG